MAPRLKTGAKPVRRSLVHVACTQTEIDALLAKIRTLDIDGTRTEKLGILALKFPEGVTSGRLVPESRELNHVVAGRSGCRCCGRRCFLDLSWRGGRLNDGRFLDGSGSDAVVIYRVRFGRCSTKVRNPQWWALGCVNF